MRSRFIATTLREMQNRGMGSDRTVFVSRRTSVSLPREASQLRKQLCGIVGEINQTVYKTVFNPFRVGTGEAFSPQGVTLG
jgi:hypothetical protein